MHLISKCVCIVWKICKDTENPKEKNEKYHAFKREALRKESAVPIL